MFLAPRSWLPLAKTVNLAVWAFSSIFLHDFTLFGIDMNYIYHISSIATTFWPLSKVTILGQKCMAILGIRLKLILAMPVFWHHLLPPLFPKQTAFLLQKIWTIALSKFGENYASFYQFNIWKISRYIAYFEILFWYCVYRERKQYCSWWWEYCVTRISWCNYRIKISLS